MSFSTLIVRPSGIAPASGGVLESVTQTLAPASAPQQRLTPEQQAHQDWLAAQGGTSALSQRGVRSGRYDEVIDPSGPSYFSYDQGEASGAGAYDDEGDRFYRARLLRGGQIYYGGGFDGPGDNIGGDTTGTNTSTANASTASISSPTAAPSAPASSGGQSTPGNTTGGLPGDPNPVETVSFGLANLAANPVSTISTLGKSAFESAVANPATTVGGLVGKSAGKGVVGAALGPAAFAGPIGVVGGLVGQTVGKGLGAIADVATSPYSGFNFGNIARASIPFFGTPIRGSNFGVGFSQEDEVDALNSLAEEAIAMGTPEPPGLEGFGNVANVTAPTTSQEDIQMEIDIARANQEVVDMPGPQTFDEQAAADAIADRGNEAELDAPPAGMDPADGPGGGDDGTVVCTALHNHNLFDARGYFAASNYGAHLYRSNPSVMRGYWKIARPFVWLVNHTPSHGKYIIRPVMRSIVKHVSGHGSPVGALIVKTLSPLCVLVGRKK